MLLKKLCELRGVSGNEDEVRALILETVKEYCDSVTVDTMGSIFAKKKGDGTSDKHVMLCGHMDEVGFMIVAIGDDGLLQYQTVGGVDSRVVISKRVVVGNKKTPGIIGAKAIHLQSREEMGRVLKHDNLYIDIGANDKKSAEALVSVGDYAWFDSEYKPMGDGLVKAKALDDRISCFAMCEILKNTYPVDITCVFSVQEEVGLRGATVASRRVNPDIGIVLEGTTANDVAGIKQHEKVCSLGKGPTISFMDNASIANVGMFKSMVDTAKRHDIPYQIKHSVTGGNDAGAIQRAGGGVDTMVISVPCRYIHSPSSVASLSDIDGMIKLVCAYLSDIK